MTRRSKAMSKTAHNAKRAVTTGRVPAIAWLWLRIQRPCSTLIAGTHAELGSVWSSID